MTNMPTLQVGVEFLCVRSLANVSTFQTGIMWCNAKSSDRPEDWETCKVSGARQNYEVIEILKVTNKQSSGIKVMTGILKTPLSRGAHLRTVATLSMVVVDQRSKH